MLAKLVELQGRAQALENRLRDLDALYESGQEDVGRIMRLKTSLETERNYILEGIRLTLGAYMPAELDDAIREVETHGNDERASESLKKLAEKRGWRAEFLEQVKQHKSEIVSTIITAAIQVAKELKF